MKRLTIIGRIATPAAMVVFMTYEISRSMAVTGAWLIAIIIGAAATAVGIEVVGILSGHALETSWRVGDQWRALLAFMLLLIYTVGAVYILRKNDTIMPVPIIAAIVYVVAALVDGLEQHKAHEETAVSQREAVDLEQLRLDRELEREIKRQQQADKTAVQLARIEAKAVTKRRSDNGQIAVSWPSDKRLLTDEQLKQIPNLTTGKLQEIAGISDSTARRWKREVPAYVNGNGATK